MSAERPQSLNQWSFWIKENFAPDGLDDDGVLAFMRHFADLGIFEPVNDNEWKFFGGDKQPDQINEAFLDRLETLSGTEEGFAVAYFLGRKPVSSNAVKKPNPRPSSRQKEASKPPNREIASDLSNLQIVKKVGRQLQPFLEFEKETISRLQGTHTQPQDARIIFNFILRQTRQKAEPKKWEQLSRKRHK